MEKSELLKQLRIDDSARDSSARSTRPIILVSVALMIAAGGIWYTLAGGTVYSVRTATAQAVGGIQGSTSVLDATGYVTARRQATVSAKVTGQVTDVLIEEGQRVQAGEVLARLDASDAQAQLNLARAQGEAARAQLEDLRLLLAQAQRDHARQRDLLARKLISQQAADNARTLVDSRHTMLVSQQRQVEVAERGIEAAEVSLDNTIVRAPFAGVVTVKAAQPGEIVSPMSAGGGFTRTGIGTIVDMDSLEIEVDVNENFINRVQRGPAGRGHAQRLSGLEDPGRGDRHHPHRRPQQGHRQGAHRDQAQDPRIVPDMGVRVAFLGRSPSAGRRAARGRADAAAALRREDGRRLRRVDECWPYGTLGAAWCRRGSRCTAGERVMVVARAVAGGAW